MIGTHAVNLTPLTGPAVDISCLVDTISINHGRDDTASQPEASTATFALSLDTNEEQWPAGLDAGATLTVTTAVAGTVYTRFSGRVTDTELAWQDAAEETPNSQEMQVIAAGKIADLGRRVVGDTPWAQEIDGSRIGRIMSAAGVTLDPLYSDPGTVQILARDVDSQPALDLSQSVAADAGGVVWNTRAGDIRYADANHRRNTQPALELNSCDILVTPKWQRSTSGIVNKVSIGYGVTPEGSEQPRYVAQNDASIGKWGRWEITATTQLAAQADAAAMGSLLLTRNKEPVWLMPTLPVDVAHLDTTRYKALLALEMHDLVFVTGLPVAGAAPTTAYLWVEGWTENLEYGKQEIELAVSGYCRTAPAPRWDDINPAVTWDTAPGTWDEASCIGPQPYTGRWNDVPASTRWNTVPNTVTWDTASGPWVGG